MYHDVFRRKPRGFCWNPFFAQLLYQLQLLLQCLPETTPGAVASLVAL